MKILIIKIHNKKLLRIKMNKFIQNKIVIIKMNKSNNSKITNQKQNVIKFNKYLKILILTIMNLILIQLFKRVWIINILLLKKNLNKLIKMLL